MQYIHFIMVSTEELGIIFGIAIVIMSVVIHEVSHGFMALYFGDQTAKVLGRLTLNPLKHLDPIGSVIVPAVLIMTGAPFPFGWARPVPYNPRNLVGGRKAELLVAAAGVIANFSIAIIFGLLIRLAIMTGYASAPFITIASVIILANLGLGIFNLLPIPPLDGSKIVSRLLPVGLFNSVRKYEQYSFVLVLGLLFFLWQFDFISPIITFLFSLITGFHI